MQTELKEFLENKDKPVQEKKAEPVQFFEKVSVMTDVDEVEQACTELVQELKLDGLQPKSRSNKLSPYWKHFKNLQPTPDTGHLFYPYKAKGKSEFIQRHLFFKFAGLEEIDWDKASEDIKERRQERQAKSSSKDELADALKAPNKVFNLDLYLKTTIQLLNSNDPYELAVGLIAASGRRPSEIVMLSEFEISDWIPPYINNAEYGVKVIGLAKKRDKEVLTYTPLLVPANDFVSRIQYFRSLPEIKGYHDRYNNLLNLGWDKEYAWKKIEEQVGYEIRKITKFYFDFLLNIDENCNRTNIVLRACTTKILTLRDCPGVARRPSLTYAGVIDGHVIPEFKDDGSVKYDGKVSASTLHYDDYDPDTTEIPFLSNVLKTATVTESKILTEIKETEDMARIAELETIIAQLNAQIAEKDARIAELEARNNRPKLEPMELSKMDTTRLLATRKAGSAEEKLNRAWQAVTAYNDKTPEYKINPTNKVLRELTGVNGKTISDWMDSESQKEKIKHYRDTHKMTEYYNTRYRNKTDMNVEIILEIIERDLKQV
ncbi:hypothetical protein HW132_30900 [Brasilonema sp. CT11]|nr:hypothetical protein [Brasilonema sp. CT11]